MFLSLLRCALDVLATGKRVNHGGECGLEIPNFFFFMDQKLATDETKIEENLKKTVKRCLK